MVKYHLLCLHNMAILMACVLDPTGARDYDFLQKVQIDPGGPPNLIFNG
jgi:hypothetical protein